MQQPKRSPDMGQNHPSLELATIITESVADSWTRLHISVMWRALGNAHSQALLWLTDSEPLEQGLRLCILTGFPGWFFLARPTTDSHLGAMVLASTDHQLHIYWCCRKQSPLPAAQHFSDNSFCMLGAFLPYKSFISKTEARRFAHQIFWKSGVLKRNLSSGDSTVRKHILFLAMNPSFWPW